MNCFITDMREKEIINLRDGCRLGAVCDVEFDTCSGNIVSIVVFGRSKVFGFGGKGEDIKICWNDIKVIGDDTILVDFDCPKECKNTSNNNFLDSLFRHK
ncbi:MAG: YlmC/YmxH family sporulation protein [Clostridia bacterium]|nr:YlmC/YmxH family sporulation protein [Clostridia bacterium]